MKIGDFVSVHFEDGCHIGMLESIDGDHVTVSFNTITGERMSVCEILKEFCSLYVSVKNKE